MLLAVSREQLILHPGAVQSLSPTLQPMDYSMPGFPVHYQLPELAQTHVRQVTDAI